MISIAQLPHPAQFVAKIFTLQKLKSTIIGSNLYSEIVSDHYFAKQGFRLLPVACCLLPASSEAHYLIKLHPLKFNHSISQNKR